MGRTPRCSKDGLNKGAWTADEDKILTDYIRIHGEGKWSNVARVTGLRRCGKSCRLRWMNYLRPDIKRGNISHDEEELIIRLHKLLGNRWSLIAGRLPGRTDNEIKNYWNTNLSKKSSDQLPVHAIINTEKRLKPRPVNVTVNEQPSSTFKKANSLPAAAGNSVNFTSAGAGNPQNNTNMGQPPCVDGNWAKNTTNETEWSSDVGSPSSMSRENNSSDFMLDFNMDDFCKILDSDFTKFSEIHNNHLVEGDGKGDQPSIFPAKMEENWRDITATEGVETDMGTSEFLSLASSFLESAEEWLGNDLNISHHHVD